MTSTTDNRTTEKKSPAEAKGDCIICKGWVDDGRGGTCVFTDDYWSPNCPYDEQDRPMRGYPLFGFC